MSAVLTANIRRQNPPRRFRRPSIGRAIVPRSRHRRVAVVDGGVTQNFNAGVRLWTDPCLQTSKDGKLIQKSVDACLKQ
jgi:hypothetical protein